MRPETTHGYVPVHENGEVDWDAFVHQVQPNADSLIDGWLWKKVEMKVVDD